MASPKLPDPSLVAVSVSDNVVMLVVKIIPLVNLPRVSRPCGSGIRSQF